MPYVPADQKNLAPWYRTLNVGNLTYELQQLVQAYLLDRMHDDPEQHLRYAHLSEAKAALLGCYDDLQQRLVAPYEERKCLENGDVWSPELLKEVGVL